SPPAKKSRQDESESDRIVLRVENPSKLDENGVWSETKIIGGFPWKLHACARETDVTRLFVSLHCSKSIDTNVWFADTSFKLVKDNSEIQMVEHRFDFLSDHVEIDPGDLGNQDKTIVIEAREITVKEDNSNRFRLRSSFDPFVSTKMSDGILVVEEKKIYVSKQLLSLHSPFFHTLFYGDFKESKESEIKLEDVKLDDFVLFLKMIYRTAEPLTACTVDALLKLADQFDVKILLDDIEIRLIQSTEFPLSLKLRLATQYNLITLKDVVMTKMSSTQDILDIKRSDDFDGIPEEIKVELFEKYARLCKCGR
ncbi:hypothetical protein PFISCL1PPCAC_20265, partial [Pristionchus fissidentatus]